MEILSRIFPCLFLASGSAGSLWPFLDLQMRHSSLCLCYHMTFFLRVSLPMFTWPSPFCVSLFKFPSYKDTSHWSEPLPLPQIPIISVVVPSPGCHIVAITVYRLSNWLLLFNNMLSRFCYIFSRLGSLIPSFLNNIQYGTI